MAKKAKVISIIIPCHNEEEGVASVINEIPKKRLKFLGYTVDVLVIDNNSSDNTAEVAKGLGARVIKELRQGKGRAIKTAFLNIHKDAEFIIMLDGDDTYKAHEIPRLIEPLESGFCDVIIGSRLEGKMNGKSMQFSHRLANWFFTFMVRHFYFANVTDTCTGFFAWKRHVITSLNGHIKSKGFAIEAEMITKMARMGHCIYSVPITYDKRAGDSKLAPLGDGLKITKMLIKNMKWKPNPNIKRVTNKKVIQNTKREKRR
ncbi:glycosyltransferase family 2 protein [Candidatus Pacearchaeota archaeon]|nr:glycosyltransferase family 2 protein [Candidatus Pacearchaeota archaeon]